MKLTATKKFLFVLLLLAVAAAVLAYPTANIGIAYGDSYGGVNTADLWYFGEDALDLAAAKAVVNGWDTSKLAPKIIAVADTGIDPTHEIYDGVLYTDASGQAMGYNAFTDKEVPASELTDDTNNKHGNSVAGIVAMLIKEFGLEDAIKIYPIKVPNESDGYISPESTKNAILKARNIDGNGLTADAITLAFGAKSNNTWTKDRELPNTILDASADIFIVAAACNEGAESSTEANIYYPAGYDGVYSVMNYFKTSQGKIAIYSDSNFGSEYDIAAPGIDIYTSFKATDDEKYHTLSGTSMGTPMAAFAGVLLKLRYEAEEDRQLTGKEVSLYMRNAGFKTVDKAGSTRTYKIKCLDFKSVVANELSGIYYADPTSIELIHDGTLGSDDYAGTIVMHASKVSEIHFSAKILPFGDTDPNLGESIEWYLRRTISESENDKVVSNTLLGTGSKLNYTATEYGEYEIVARLVYDEKEIEASQDVYIQYGEYYVDEVRVTYIDKIDLKASKAPSHGAVYTKETTVFGLTGMQLVDKSVPIKWYVDGELMGEGETFAYTPSKLGKHTISASYGDRTMADAYTFKAEVLPFIARPLDLSMLIIGLVIIAVASGIGISVAVKKKKATANAQQQTDKQNAEQGTEE